MLLNKHSFMASFLTDTVTDVRSEDRSTSPAFETIGLCGKWKTHLTKCVHRTQILPSGKDRDVSMVMLGGAVAIRPALQ